MKIIYKHGDLRTCEEKFFAHGCNAQGVMGSGVAAWVRSDFPWGWEQYRETYEEQGNFLELGQVIVTYDKKNPCKGKVVLDCVTQEFFGRDPNIVYVSYDAVRVAIETINNLVYDGSIPCPPGDQPLRIAFPLIGAGLANGKWSIISEIIEEEAVLFQPVVYLLDGKIPDGVQGQVQ